MIPEKVLVGVAYNAYEPVAGRSNERVSEESVQQAAQDVFDAVSNLGYRASMLPLQRSIAGFLDRLKGLKPDVIVNLCEGFRGWPKFEHNVAGLFELLDVPFTGGGSRALAYCIDKFKTKAILRSHGLPVANGTLAVSADQAKGLAFPMIVKPNAEDASLGVYADSVVSNLHTLAEQIKKVNSTYKQPALVEEFLEGREFNVAVKGHATPEALPVSEIDFSTMPEGQPHILGYEAKWFDEHILNKTTVPVCPAKIDDAIKEKLQNLAKAAFLAMGCRDYARVDFRMNTKGEALILEVNPNPDISRGAGYARALRAAGIDYMDFWQELVENARKRKEFN
jgi:D-alanine-D-alanine ligase